MTVDTAALRALAKNWMTQHGPDVVALCDALDAERERTRALRDALTALAAGSVRVQRQWFRDHGMPEVAERFEAYPDALARAALAIVDAGEDGGTA